MDKLNVFLSWSGEQSKIVAKALKRWLPLALGDGINPWFSDTDIGAGKRFVLELGRSLEASGIGILCITGENRASPWVMFEAGALSKSLNGGAVIPYLIGVEMKDLVGPLKEFQSKKATREGTFEVLTQINDVMASPVIGSTLELRFTSLWPSLERDIERALREHSSNYLGGWWVYSLLAETSEWSRDTVGYFCLKHHPDGAEIGEARALWVIDDALVHRGDWKSDAVWISREMIRLIYRMIAVKVTEGVLEYDGYLELRPTTRKPILGRSSWVGSFNDLKNRGLISGPVYAEYLSPLANYDLDELQTRLADKKDVLLGRVREIWPDLRKLNTPP